MHSNLIKDWRNGMSHVIPISGNYTLFNYLKVNPSFNFTDRMYSNKIMRKWDPVTHKEIRDTLYGFYNVYDWNVNMNFSTTMYGMFIPNRKMFGDKVEAIRHVFTPKISFNYTPDFGADRYGYYDTYQVTDADGNTAVGEIKGFIGMEARIAVNGFAGAKGIRYFLPGCFPCGHIGVDAREGEIEQVADGALLYVDMRRNGWCLLSIDAILCHSQGWQQQQGNCNKSNNLHIVIN